MLFQTKVESLRKRFEGQLIDGQQVVDEKCSCGHFRSEHFDRFDIGHGSCGWPKCPCAQFTWVGWVTKPLEG